VVIVRVPARKKAKKRRAIGSKKRASRAGCKLRLQRGSAGGRKATKCRAMPGNLSASRAGQRLSQKGHYGRVLNPSSERKVREFITNACRAS
jgi:hypothetical protein